jgi:protein tyrosine phosphatase (PTP) superfamily phosphohydrolase (DUF442 family)
MRYYEFRYLVEGYPQAQAAFIQAGADPQSVQKTIADFKSLVARNQIKDINQKNIDWWAKQGWDKFNQFVNQAAAIPSKTQVTRKKLPGQSINLVDNANWFIVIPLDKEASCFHGKNSDWCTTKTNQSNFEKYFYDTEVTLIYCINKSTGGMWAIAAHKKTDEFEMFDQRDRSLTAQEFKQQTGLDPDQLRAMALGDTHQPKIQDSRDKWKASVALTEKLLSELPVRARSAEIEKQLLYNKDAKLCYLYIEKLNEIDSKNFPESIQIAAVKQDGRAIYYIDNPDPEVQLAAVKQNGLAISYIKNPTPAVQLAAVNQDGYAIKHIKNPDPEVQLAAVKQNGLAIMYIPNPAPEVQLAAVKQDGLAIYYIDNPDPEVQLAVVKRNGLAIKHIKNPAPEVQLAAVKQDGLAIMYIPNPDPEVQLAAVKQDGRAIKHIKNPAPEVQLAAVKQDGRAIMYIPNPDPEVQLAAVKQDGRAIMYIPNPDPELQMAAAKQVAARLKNNRTA